MGQGNFYAVIYGILEPRNYFPDRPDGDRNEWISDLANFTPADADVKWIDAYEASPDFLGIVLSVSDSSLAERWKAQEMKERFCVHLGRAGEMLCAILQARHTKAWRSFAAEANAKGIEVPEPQMLFVQDWH